MGERKKSAHDLIEETFTTYDDISKGIIRPFNNASLKRLDECRERIYESSLHLGIASIFGVGNEDVAYSLEDLKTRLYKIEVDGGKDQISDVLAEYKRHGYIEEIAGKYRPTDVLTKLLQRIGIREGMFDSPAK